VASFFAGFFTMGGFLLINNAVQRTVRDSMRGRVMALYTMSFLGAAPIGALIAGWASDHIGARMVTLTSAGLLVLFGSAGYARRLDLPSRGRGKLANPGAAG
jgi:MFS family permease